MSDQSLSRTVGDRYRRLLLFGTFATNGQLKRTFVPSTPSCRSGDVSFHRITFGVWLNVADVCYSLQTRGLSVLCSSTAHHASTSVPGCRPLAWSPGVAFNTCNWSSPSFSTVAVDVACQCHVSPPFLVVDAWLPHQHCRDCPVWHLTCVLWCDVEVVKRYTCFVYEFKQ